MKVPTRSYRLTLAVALWAGTLTGVLSSSVTSAAAAAPATLDLNVLLIGTGPTDPTTAAWQSALSSEGVAYTLATATGSYGSETVTLPALTTGSVGNFNGVVVADSPAEFAAGQLSALDTYEATFGVDQVDGYTYPYLGETDVSAGALDGTTGQLTAAGLAALPELAGPVPFATGSYGYPSAVNAGAPFTPWLENTAGNVLAGVYQHPSTDPQAGVPEVELNFNYSSSMLQWLLLAPGLINWVTQGTHLGLYRNYIEMDIDDTFTPDNAWSTAVHDNDYSDASSLRMAPRTWSMRRNGPRGPRGPLACRRRCSAWTSCSTSRGASSTRTANWTCPASPPAPPRRAPAELTPSWLSSRPQTRRRASLTRTTSAGSATPTTRRTLTSAARPRTTSRPS